MEPIRLIGTKIVRSQRMQRSGLMRYTFELTENDSKQYAGSLAIAEVLNYCFDVSIVPTEIEGNDNGSEKTIWEPDSNETSRQRFKRLCEERFGNEFYLYLKKQWNVQHLKEIPDDKIISSLIWLNDSSTDTHDKLLELFK